MSLSALGSNLRLKRIELDVAQAALCGAVGITQSRLSKIERGSVKVTAEELGNIARFLGVPIAEFFRRPRALTPRERLALYIFEYELGPLERQSQATSIISAFEIYGSGLLVEDSPFAEAE